jgi:hypothetical protein
MANFAQLDNSNNVLQVIVVSNDVIDNLPFPESEAPGIEFCQSLFGSDTLWAQTSYNASFRYNYAGIGYTFDVSAQPSGAFIAPCPGPNYVLDTTTYQWVPKPASDNPPPAVI